MITDCKAALPRLPLKGSIDLTYRCNNTCRHCWLWLPAASPQGDDELTFAEIRHIVDEARAMGCQRWHISGGEPMLRPDFSDIFDYITRKSISYDLNTNGTLITPAIANLMTRKGSKMVALYGASADVHDHITRNPGSFEATMRGFAYLKEAGAGFIVQLIPMRESYHQFDDMVKLALSLSPHYRVGASWLYLSACRSEARNREIARQRLEPAEVIALEPPYATEQEPAVQGVQTDDDHPAQGHLAQDDRLFAACLASRREFHIDPNGRMTFCSFIKDPLDCPGQAALRFDLRQGSFRQAWEEFIPSLADAVHGGQEYRDNCGSCKLRSDCRWCAVYGYLEHGRYGARVEYLCQIAEETRHFKEQWQQQHIRYYQIAGMTIQVEADLPISNQTFDVKFKAFEVDGPGEDTSVIHHHFGLPDVTDKDLGKLVYRRAPWAVYQRNGSWIYLSIHPDPNDRSLNGVAVFNADHTRGRSYHTSEVGFQQGGLHSLTHFPTDQIMLARLLADRQGFYLHAAGAVLDGHGLLFVGHSEAGKTTMTRMLQGYAGILCDDRIIVRRWPDGFRIHGTWSHGDIPIVSPAAAPLRAVLFLEKATTNQLLPIQDKREVSHRVVLHVVKPLVTVDWWEKVLGTVEAFVQEVPAYRLEFDKSGRVVDVLRELTSPAAGGRTRSSCRA